MDAPLGIKVNDFPEQIEPLFIVKIGLALTVTVLMAVFEAAQPDVLVPITL